jgi:ketol-acid reductoisomerase
LATVYYEKDCDLSLIKGKKIAIIGYGSQGHAHALNLRDNGCTVMVGLYEGSKSWQQAGKDGLEVATTDRAAAWADVVMILAPDQYQKAIYEKDVKENLEAGNMLMFAHGFSILFDQVVPPTDVDVTMIAPKSPGHVMRDMFKDGVGVPGLLAVQHDATGQGKALALAYGAGIGCARAGIVETTFKEEAETDLFGEQAVLCGGVTALMQAGYEILVDAGYQPEMAYFECINEMKLIVDLIFKGGMGMMRYSISDTAEFGDYTAGPRVIDDHVKANMRQLLAEIQNGEFAKKWILENQAGRPSFNAMRRRAKEHSSEQVGAELRAMMPWINK